MSVRVVCCAVTTETSGKHHSRSKSHPATEADGRLLLPAIKRTALALSDSAGFVHQNEEPQEPQLSKQGHQQIVGLVTCLLTSIFAAPACSNSTV